MRFISVVVVMCFLTSCGPMAIPMFRRLPDDQQAKIDQAWSRMLEDKRVVSRQTLFDALTWYQLYESGVDRASFRSEKMVDGKLVVMEVQYDISHPRHDLFTVSIYGSSGELIREEHYSRSEVESLMGLKRDIPTTQPGEPPSPAQVAYELEFKRRMEALYDATGLDKYAKAFGVEIQSDSDRGK